MWKGRFKEDTFDLVQEYTCSLDVDRNFCLEDLEGSKAHVKMLARQKIITDNEAKRIIYGLEQIKREIEEGEFKWKKELEDVHMNIEHRLIEIIGETGKKIHTARSRNDQVVLDFRMYVSKKLYKWQEHILKLIEVLINKAEKHVEVVIPGFTHLQPAQPISLAHHLLAYVFMLKRDVERIDDLQKRVRISPLGACALGGTTYDIDPAFVAKELGFYGVFDNSIDAVSDRDFVAESLFVGTCIMMHLSRLCEDFIIWSNPYFGFIKLPDKFATGSSIMPQKKNPDILELMRGKTGRVYGNLFAVMNLLKGLPLAYNRDLQEDKYPFMDTSVTVLSSLKVLTEFIKEVEFNKEKMRSSLKEGFINATEFADYLVKKGISFRDAHFITGKMVAYAEKNHKSLEDLSLEEMKNFCPLIENDIYEVLDYNNCVKRRNSLGGTGFNRVKEQIEHVKLWLNKKNGGSV